MESEGERKPCLIRTSLGTCSCHLPIDLLAENEDAPRALVKKAAALVG